MTSTLQQALKEHFGFDSFKGHQEAIISSLMDGRDVFVLMPTGAANLSATSCPPCCSKGRR